MSQGQPVPLEQARAVADELVELLRPECERIEIAGSIRRRKPMVRDIEIVAISRLLHELVQSFFAELAEAVTTDLLSARVNALIREFRLDRREVEVHRKDGRIEMQQRNGERYKALLFGGLPVDLFITKAETWGTVLALRTGPGDWNTKLVTDCQRFFRRVEGLRVLHLGKPVSTPEEADFFAAIGQPWVDPWERRLERVAVTQPELLARVRA